MLAFTVFLLVCLGLTTGQSTVEKVSDSCVSLTSLMDEVSQLKEMTKSLIAEKQKPVTMVRRFDGSVNFERGWSAYRAGFGRKDGEFWLGLQRLHEITWERDYGVRVTMTAWDNTTYWAYYSSFGVGSEADNYRLSVSGYDKSSTAGDSMKVHNGMQFSTGEQDNDVAPDANCAAAYKSGWWYNYCFNCNPTGLYIPGGVVNHRGITWHFVPGFTDRYSFKEMTLTLMPLA